MKTKKQKTNSKLVIIAAALILFTTGILAQAQGYGFMGRGQRGDMGQRRVLGQRGPDVMTLYRVLRDNREDLEISDAQLEKIKQMIFSFEEKMVDMKHKTSVQQLEMKKLMPAEKKDYKKIKAALTTMSGLRHDVLIEGMKTQDAIKNILTPEQQEALKKLRNERPMRHRFIQRDHKGRCG